MLCLTVFSLLSLSTVSADHRIAEDNSQALKAYYQADAEANRILAQIREGKRPEGVEIKEAGGVYEFSCRVSDTQLLAVKVQADGSAYRVLKWQMINNYDWQPDTDLPVWLGD